MLKSKHFETHQLLIHWVNTNINIDDIISITSANGSNNFAGYILFYKNQQ